mmetsp:Transcript_22128/g.39246  ORF Transcript_22128/g.39246 Transcript_22128/m.39246 type:complete len:268 (-) Transcript_22128:24-827(-)
MDPPVYLFARLEDSNINIRSRAQIVVYTSHDGICDQLNRLLLGESILVSCFQFRHCCKRTGTHGCERKTVDRSVRVDGVQKATLDIHTPQDKGCTDMTLVSVQVPLQHGHCSHDAWLLTSGQAKELKLRFNLTSYSLCIGSSTCTTAPNVIRNLVNLFAALVDYEARGGPGICSEHHAAVENAPSKRGPRLMRFRQIVSAAGLQNHIIPKRVFKLKPSLHKRERLIGSAVNLSHLESTLPAPSTLQLLATRHAPKINKRKNERTKER